MKYITITENNSERPNVGTITGQDTERCFKEAIEAHFDAEMVGFNFVDINITSLQDCISAYPIEVIVTLEPLDPYTVEVTLSQTWMYL